MTMLAIAVFVCLYVAGTGASDFFNLPPAMSLQDYNDNWDGEVRALRVYYMGEGRDYRDAKGVENVAYRLSNGSYIGTLTGVLNIDMGLGEVTMCADLKYKYNNIVEGQAIMRTSVGTTVVLVSDEPTKYLWELVCFAYTPGATRCPKTYSLISFQTRQGDDSIDISDPEKLPEFEKLGLKDNAEDLYLHFEEEVIEPCMHTISL